MTKKNSGLSNVRSNDLLGSISELREYISAQYRLPRSAHRRDQGLMAKANDLRHDLPLYLQYTLEDDDDS